MCIHTHTPEYYSATGKKEILPFATTWMNLEGIMLSEISQIGKNKYCMISLTCRTLKKAELTETETRMLVARGGGKRGDVGQRVQTSRY